MLGRRILARNGSAFICGQWRKRCGRPRAYRDASPVIVDAAPVIVKGLSARVDISFTIMRMGPGGAGGRGDDPDGVALPASG